MPLLVVTAALTLYTYVSITQRFDGRLWAIPSRVHSDLLRLAPGDRITAGELKARFERNGYAAVSGAPERPGQFRASGRELVVFTRAFEAPGGRGDAERLTLTFDDERLRSVRGADGRARRRVQLEPERLATLYGPRQEERRPLSIDEVPQRLIRAVLAAEDARFETHEGIDVRGVLRAAWVNLRSGKVVQGGSTITQQTAKNLYLHQRRTWWRKAREALMAVILDARYEKRHILEVYLNEVYLGQQGSVAICGVEAASRFYFGRGVADLDVAESALLAGLIRSPGGYNPFRNPERAIERREQVLQAMQRLGDLTPQEAETAAAEPLRLGSGKLGVRRAPYAIDFVQAQLDERFPREALQREGIDIFTTIDLRIQERVERILAEELARLERERPKLKRPGDGKALEGAVIVLRPSDGAILAMVGGRDYGRSQFNRATQARRQPGSCFKPFVMAAGFERATEDPDEGLTPATMLDDSPLELESGGEIWRPSNYDRQFRGPVTARRALQESLNVPTVRAALRVGLDRVVATARRCGIESPLRPLPSLALGAAEVTPLELAEAYSVFAAGGVRTRPWILRSVHDADGARLDRASFDRARAISSETAFLVGDLLAGVFRDGTARSAAALGFIGPGAGKTGTTDDTRDAWFVGFTGDRLVLVWVGFDDNERTGLTGASGALPIWVRVMNETGGADEPWAPVPPDDIVLARIDPDTGALAHGGCPKRRWEYFRRGTEPTQECTVHGGGRMRRWFRRWFDRDDPV